MRWLPSPARVLVAVVGTYSLGLLITHPTLHSAMTYSLIADAPLPLNFTFLGGNNGSSAAIALSQQGANTTRLRGKEAAPKAAGRGSGGAKPKATAKVHGVPSPVGIGEQEALEGYRYFGIPAPSRYAARIEGRGRSGGCPSATPIDFTLVTQASLERLWMLPHICQRWEGPVVVAVFQVPPLSEDDEAMEHEAGLLRQAHEGCGGRAKLVVVRPPSGSKVDWTSPDAFPVNSLRNMGVWEVSTSHFLLADVDLWPSLGLYSHLRRLAQAKGSRRKFHDPLSAFVVPAFSLQPPPDFFEVPLNSSEAEAREVRAGRQQQLVSFMPTSNMQELSSCLLTGRCIVFDGHYNPQGHASTDSMFWLTQQKAHSLRRLHCFQSNRYEPYLVLRRCDVTTPLFAEAFSGYGKNKIQHVQHLRHHAFTFYVLPPPLFLVHYPHANSAAKDSWLQLQPPAGNDTAPPAKSPHRQRMDLLYGQFQHWAAQHATARNHTPTTPLC